jgi:hypothetical protein
MHKVLFSWVIGDLYLKNLSGPFSTWHHSLHRRDPSPGRGRCNRVEDGTAPGIAITECSLPQPKSVVLSIYIEWNSLWRRSPCQGQGCHGNNSPSTL